MRLVAAPFVRACGMLCIDVQIAQKACHLPHTVLLAPAPSTVQQDCYKHYNYRGEVEQIFCVQWDPS